MTKYHRLGGFNNCSLILRVLEAGVPGQVLAQSGVWFASWFAGSCLKVTSSQGGDRETSDISSPYEGLHLTLEDLLPRLYRNLINSPKFHLQVPSY